MTTFARKTAIVVLTSAVALAVSALPAAASQPKLLLVPPGGDPGCAPDFPLPQFGFSSFNIGGVGERVVFVRPGGMAFQLGLEPGDVILSMNDVRLTYQGSWSDALRHAITHHGGWVQLRIRDVRTGLVAHRHTFVGGAAGPVVHHYNHGLKSGSPNPHVFEESHVAPAAPFSPKTIAGKRRVAARPAMRDLHKLID